MRTSWAQTQQGFQKGPDSGPSCPGQQPVDSGRMRVAVLGLRAHAKPPASGAVRGLVLWCLRVRRGTEERLSTEEQALSRFKPFTRPKTGRG